MDTATLAHRLRELRQRQWDTPVTQPVLGELLGVKPPTISSWERPVAPVVPPEERLAAYAVLFATPRSLTAGRALTDEELDDAERARRDDLLAELGELRRRALAPAAAAADPWEFADGAPVRIICGKLADPPASARGHRWNYMALSAYADLDAMVELYGHVRSRNPDSDVRVTLAGRLRDNDLRAHLVLLGNLAMSQTDLRALLPGFPVRQVHDDTVEDGEVFEIGATGRRFPPTFLGSGPGQRVIEDVGFLARTPSPLNGARTVTVLSGTYTRGVYGAVRCLTDRELVGENAAWLRRRFGGEHTYGLLVRVPGTDHAISTPRLADDHARLYEFPPRPATLAP